MAWRAYSRLRQANILSHYFIVIVVLFASSEEEAIGDAVLSWSVSETHPAHHFLTEYVSIFGVSEKIEKQLPAFDARDFRIGDFRLN